MQIQALDDEVLDRLLKAHLELVRKALTKTFKCSEAKAEKLVSDLSQKFATAPRTERELMLHNHPISLAADLIGTPSSAIDDKAYQIFDGNLKDDRDYLARNLA